MKSTDYDNVPTEDKDNYLQFANNIAPQGEYSLKILAIFPLLIGTNI